MRTDTATFRKTAFDALRAQGVSCAKAKKAVAILVADLRLRGYPRLEAEDRIAVSMDDEREQSIAIVRGMTVLAHVSAFEFGKLQPLVNATPTARQVEIGEILSDMIPDLHGAIGDACQAYEAEHGYPRSEAEFDARSAYCDAFPAVAEVKARYDALKAESLAINPRISGRLVDPYQFSHWYEWVHDARGYRPQGFMTLAMIEADMETLPSEILDEAA